jgi:hypothetical protein
MLRSKSNANIAMRHSYITTNTETVVLAMSSGKMSGASSCNSNPTSQTTGTLSERRKIRTKKWAQVYTEKIAKTENDDLQKKIDQEENKDWLSGVWARTMIAKRLSRLIKQKIRLKSHSCKKSLLNLQYPTQVTEWRKDWGSQLMCTICHTPAIYDSIVCNTCNSIAHLSCVENHDDNDHILIRRDETEDEDATTEYYCADCNNHEQLEKADYQKELTRLKHDRYMKQMVSRITSTIKTRIERIRFLKQRQLTIILQALARRHFIRRRFHQRRRNQIRIILFDIVSLPKIDGACMVVWTVVDKFKNHQIFRLDKEIHRAMTEGESPSSLPPSHCLRVPHPRHLSERVSVPHDHPE